MRPSLLNRRTSSCTGHSAQGQVTIHVQEGVHARKSLRRDPHDRHRMPVNVGLLSDYTLVASEALLPVGIAQHEDGIGSWCLSFRGKNKAAQCGLDPQGRKVIARHPADYAMLAFAVNQQSD